MFLKDNDSLTNLFSLGWVQFSGSVLSLYDPVGGSTPGLHVHHQLPEFTQTRPLSRWYHPTISSSVIPFSHLQSFPASGSFPMNQFFASGGQRIGVSASASVLTIKSLFLSMECRQVIIIFFSPHSYPVKQTFLVPLPKQVLKLRELWDLPEVSPGPGSGGVPRLARGLHGQARTYVTIQNKTSLILQASFPKNSSQRCHEKRTEQ